MSLGPLLPTAQAEESVFKLKLITSSPGGSRPMYVCFLGANPKPEAYQKRDTAGHFNPMMGNDPGNDPLKWRGGISATRQLIYRQLYPGIDLICFNNNGQMEHQLNVSAWADPTRMKVSFTGSPDLDFSGPLPAYQIVDGVQVPVTVSIRKTLDDAYEYVIGRYDRSKDLIIASTNPAIRLASK